MLLDTYLGESFIASLTRHKQRCYRNSERDNGDRLKQVKVVIAKNHSVSVTFYRSVAQQYNTVLLSGYQKRIVKISSPYMSIFYRCCERAQRASLFFCRDHT